MQELPNRRSCSHHGDDYQSSPRESVVSGVPWKKAKEIFDAYVEKIFQHRAPQDKRLRGSNYLLVKLAGTTDDRLFKSVFSLRLCNRVG